MRFVFNEKNVNLVISLIELLKLSGLTSRGNTIHINIQIAGPKLVDT